MNELSELPEFVRDAHQKDLLVVAFLSDLFKDGIPVKGDGALVIAVLDPPTHRTGIHRRLTGTVSDPDGGHRFHHPPHPMFEGGEHIAIGNSVTLNFAGLGARPAATTPITLGSQTALTYGEIVALAGDFYGIPATPISSGTTFEQQVQYFAAAFNSLNEDSTGQPAQILAVMQTEIQAVQQAIRNGQQSSSAYDALGDTLSAQWNRITGGGSLVSPWVPSGRYLQLASVNFDHFSQDAVTAYTAGHSLALDLAVMGSQESTTAAQNDDLRLAYAINAFADHYLTDLFSAGHQRTPRRQLYDGITPSAVGSLLARAMHDEDSEFGLVVTSNDGSTTWRGYGDKRYADSVDLTSAGLVNRATQTSVDEIWQAFSTGQTIPPANFAALQLIPNLTQVQQYGAQLQTNTSPLFAPSGNTVAVRNSINDLNDYSWTTSWVGLSTLAKLLTIYNPALPAHDVPPPATSVTISGWSQQQPSPPNWVGNNSVRYAVSFTNTGFWESNPGPWSAWVPIPNAAFPILTGLPTNPASNAGRRVWRQFTNGTPTLVATIANSTATQYVDTMP